MVILKSVFRKIVDVYDFIGVGLIVFLVPLFFSWFFWGNIAFELNKTALFRTLLILSILSLLLKFFIRGRIALMMNKYRLIFGALALSSIFISALLANSRLISFWGDYNRQQGFYTLFFYILFFLFLSVILKSAKQIKNLLIVLISSSTLVCVYGCLQLVGIDFIAWSDPTIIAGRMFSSVGQPNFLGHFLVLIIPTIIYFIYSKAQTRLSKILLSLTLLLHLFCLYSTYSRSAWIALLLSLFVFVVWKLFLMNKKKIALLLSFSLVILVALSVFFSASGRLTERFAYSDSMFLRRIASSFDVKGGSVQGRFNYWKAGLNEIRSMNPTRLLFGFGPDSLYDVFARNYEPSWAVYERSIPDRAHNIFLDIFLQFGLFGLFVFVCFFVFLVRKLTVFLKNEEKDKSYYLVVALSFSLLANFVYNLFSFSLTVHLVILCLFLAMMLFVIDRGNERMIYIKWPLALRAAVFMLILFFSVLVMFYYNIRFIIADDYYYKSKAASNCVDSWEYAFLASQSNRSSVYYKNMLMSELIDCMERSRTRQEMMFVGEKAKYSLDYVKNDKGDFHLLLNKATISGMLGGEYAQYSSDTFSFLEEEYGSIDLIYQYRAYTQIMRGDYNGAISTMKKGLAALPSLEDFEIDNIHKEAVSARMFKFYELIGRAYEAKGEKEKAVPYYEGMLFIYPAYLPTYDKLINIFDDIDKNRSLYYKNMKKKYE